MAGSCPKTDSNAFRSPHILAEDFGPGVHYGYGIAVDTLDGNRLLRHTGGMVSFMSSLMVDIDEGVGGFASVNAQQSYRPNPVVKYAIQLMRAQRKGVALPAHARSRTFAASVTQRLPTLRALIRRRAQARRVIAEGERLFVVHEGERIPLERLSEADRFVARHPRSTALPLSSAARTPRLPDSAVVEVSWGGDWYRNAKYEGPDRFELSEGLGQLRRALPQREPLDRQPAASS